MKTTTLGIIVVIVVVVAAIGAYVATMPSGPVTTTAAQKLKVAVVYLAPIECEYWNLQINDPLNALVSKGVIEYKYTESVAPPDAERVARTYIGLGYKLMFFHSWYPDAVKMIGKEFPDVNTLSAGGGTELAVLYPPPTPVPKNVGHYDTYMHESAFLAGVLAGKMTKTNKMGIVAGFPVANANRYFNGFIEGVKFVKENTQFKVTWVLSWSDPPKAKEAAKAIIEWGADFIYTDMLPGAEKATEESGGKCYVITSYRSEPGLAPNSAIATVLWDLNTTINTVVNSTINKTFESREYFYGLAQGGTDLIINLPNKVPADVTSYINVLKQEIKDGKFLVNPNINNPEQVWKL